MWAKIGYHGQMASRTFTIPKSKSTNSFRTSAAIDIAARYFVYKLFEATNRQPMAWLVLREMGEAAETIARAVERGWVIVRPNESGRVNEHSGCLTDEGRRIARKSLV